MPDNTNDAYWTDDEITKRLTQVREALLEFLYERTRLDWFKHKIRWRLSRQFIWPAAPEARASMLNAAVEDDVSVEAFSKHLSEQQHTISDAIERYNHALRRRAEEKLHKPVKEFSHDELETFRRQRITFQGTRDELLWRAREVTADSTTELIPELLSLRLAILVNEVRDEIFGQVAAIVADEQAEANAEMSAGEREIVAAQTEMRLRCLDRTNVARLLAESYTEGRRFMRLDTLLERYKALTTQLREGDDPVLAAKIELFREILTKSVAALEEIFPSSAGTHDRMAVLLR